jgi:CMP-N-acetylneuraminic acid synthetase
VQLYSKKYLKILNSYLRKDNLRTKNIIFDHRNELEANKKKKIFDYIKNDLIKKFKFTNKDLIVQMLPTAPLRERKTLLKAIYLAKKTKKDVFTVNKYDFHISFAMSLNKKKKWRAVFKNSPLITGKTQSQDQKEFFKPNPVANCIWYKNLKNKKTIYEKSLAIISQKIESIDIDDKNDYLLVKSIMKK